MRGFRADLAALGLGALAAAALPPFNIIPVLLISVPGLLILIDAARSPAVAARRGWWFGFGHHVIGLYWITEAILFEAARFWWLVPLAVPAVAAGLAVFIAAACCMARLAPRRAGRASLALAGAWVLADLARQFVLTGFPWNPWGSVWEIPGPVGDVFIQPAAWVGVHGLTLVTLLLAALPVLGWRWRAAGAALLAAWIGGRRLAAAADRSADRRWPWCWCRATSPRARSATRHSRCGSSGIIWISVRRVHARRAAAVTVSGRRRQFPGLLDLDEPARQAIERATGGVPALVGSVRFDAAERPRNSLFAVLDGGAIGGVYDKWHLVPFGEYHPGLAATADQVCPAAASPSGPGPAYAARSGIAAVRTADLLRGDLSRPDRGSPRPAGLAGERHQRRLVRQLDRPAPAPRGGADARGGGGAAAAARGEYRHFGGLRCTRP